MRRGKEEEEKKGKEKMRRRGSWVKRRGSRRRGKEDGKMRELGQEEGEQEEREGRWEEEGCGERGGGSIRGGGILRWKEKGNENWNEKEEKLYISVLLGLCHNFMNIDEPAGTVRKSGKSAHFNMA